MQDDGTSHLPFAFRIRYIREHRPANIPHQSKFSVGNHFRPPTKPAHFAFDHTDYRVNGRTYNQNQIFAWVPGQIKALNPAECATLLEYRSTSLFWCSDRAGYFILPFDCMQREAAPYPDHGAKLYDSDDEGTPTSNVSDLAGLDSNGIPIPWRRLTFGRYKGDASFSKVGYLQEHYRLGARVPDRWSNHLVPPSQSRTSEDTIEDPLNDPRCRIAGDLGALLGLCAFGSKARNTPETIKTSFRPEWGNAAYQLPPNPVPFHERAFDRGVVVDIYTGRQPGKFEQLQGWENGAAGPILT